MLALKVYAKAAACTSDKFLNFTCVLTGMESPVTGDNSLWDEEGRPCIGRKKAPLVRSIAQTAKGLDRENCLPGEGDLVTQEGLLSSIPLMQWQFTEAYSVLVNCHCINGIEDENAL
jgi:hypothetical protein